MPFLKPVNLTISTSCWLHVHSLARKSVSAQKPIAPRASGSSLFVIGTCFFQFTPSTIPKRTTPFETQGAISRILRFSFSLSLRSRGSYSAYEQSRIAFFLSLNRGINSIIIINRLLWQNLINV